VAHRKDALTGTSDYPLLTEAPATVVDASPVPIPPPAAAIRYPALGPIRLATPFEALRDASDAILKKTGARPKVFLANLGTPAEFTARATFAKNLFEADGFKDRDAMIAAFKQSGAKLACLCSADAVYETSAADTASALTAAGATVILAGRPSDALRAAGVETFVFAGCDALAALHAAHSRIAS
jgi:methylmalonyl-CoA mutase